MRPSLREIVRPLVRPFLGSGKPLETPDASGTPGMPLPSSPLEAGTQNAPPPVRRPIDVRPECYQACPTVNNGWPMAFVVQDPSDYDWLERMIHETGYYEESRPWGYNLDVDKRTMALIASYFSPRIALDIGCNTGAVMQAMLELGVSSHGVDISNFVKSKAPESVRDKIFVGDILTIDMPGTYDLVLALDIFEHLNPNRLSSYLEKLASLLDDDGYVFLNSPAWGPDRNYGTVFPLGHSEYTDAYPCWSEQAERRELFDRFPVDENGIPHMGHLIWAGSAWWEDQFNAHGLYRQDAVEVAIHQKFDWYFNLASIARRSFYVLSKHKQNRNNETVVSRIHGWDKGSVVYK